MKLGVIGLGCLLLLPATVLAAASSKPVYFIYENVPLLGRYAGDGFKAKPFKVAKRSLWAERKQLFSLDAAGHRSRATLVRIPDPDGEYYDGVELLRRDGEEKQPPTLEATDDVVEFVTPKAARLTDKTLARLKALVEESFRKALASREDAETAPVSWQLRNFRAFDIPGTGRVVAMLKLDLKSKTGETDDRGEFFALLDTRTDKVVFSSFGHPEWSPDADGLRVVRAEVFFRLKGSPKVYFAGPHFGAWESLEYAIYDLESGRALLTSL